VKGYLGNVIAAIRGRATSVGTSVPATMKTQKGRPEQNPFYYIHPDARDRWLSGQVSMYTPERIEVVIRGAMSGDLLAQWEMFDLMEGTWPRLLKNLNELKDGVCSFDWAVIPWAAKGEKPTPEAQKRAELVEELIWNMEPAPDIDENDFEGTLRDVMDAWGKGISVLETSWYQRPYEAGTAIAPRATRWIKPCYYGYPVQGEDRLMLKVSEVQRTGSYGGSLTPGQSWLVATNGDFAPFPPDNFLIAVAKQKSGHPIGSSLMRALGFWWAAANFTAEWFLNYAQIFGMPMRWASYDPNLDKPTIEIIKDMLANMGSAAWAAFPAGVTMELKEASKGGSDNAHKALMDVTDKVCDILVLRQTLTTDAADRGTQALGTVHQDVLGDVKGAAANWAARIINRQLVRSICRLNYGDTRECPFLLPNANEVKDAKSLAERDQILLNLGMEFPKEWFYERHDVPVPEDSDDIFMAAPKMGMPGEEGHEGRGSRDESRVKAKNATDKLVDNVLQDLTGIEAKWLGGVKPFFVQLVQAAQNDQLSDAEFVRVLERARSQMPELFGRLDHDAVAQALESALGAAVVNGAIKGAMTRRIRRAR
jgi:phage gp29-like protein